MTSHFFRVWVERLIPYAARFSLGSQRLLYLPETLAAWPWPRKINPYYEEVSAESRAWIGEFKPFTEKTQQAFERADVELLAALAHPTANKGHFNPFMSKLALTLQLDVLRAMCHWLNLTFVIDAYTDLESGLVVREMVRVVIDALNHPDARRPAGETILGEMTRQFWLRTMTATSKVWQQRFIDSFTKCLETNVAQAYDRHEEKLYTIENYLDMRRDNIGLRPAFVIGRFQFDLPDHVFYHPMLIEMEYLSCELVLLDNDILSYNKERRSGDDRANIISIIMNQLNLGIQEAIDWTYRYHQGVQQRFFKAVENLPEFDPAVDAQLRDDIRYSVANWPRANECWSFECQRYFGSRGLEIQKQRWVPLLDKMPTVQLQEEDLIGPMVSVQ